MAFFSPSLRAPFTRRTAGRGCFCRCITHQQSINFVPGRGSRRSFFFSFGSEFFKLVFLDILDLSGYLYSKFLADHTGPTVQISVDYQASASIGSPTRVPDNLMTFPGWRGHDILHRQNQASHFRHQRNINSRKTFPKNVQILGGCSPANPKNTSTGPKVWK